MNVRLLDPVSHRTASTYRRDIDGLRAVAVLSVVLYHCGLEFMPGGFVGVDVFFVISGFLITSIIISEASEERFSYPAFYERRIRRLLPPLIPVLIFSWIGAYLLFPTIEFDDFGKSFIATNVFSANWYFSSTIGYFDGPADLKPLLHTWSLGVEEQFYLVFPAIILFLNRRKIPLSISFGIMAVMSFVLATGLIKTGQADKAFFNSFARFWELLIGSLLAITAIPVTNRIRSTILETVGAVMLLAPVFLYTNQTVFPGIAAMAPVIGTALVISADGRGALISPILKSKIFVGIGLVSYALYLWHWPVLAFIRFSFPDAPTWLLLLGGLTALVLAIGSFHIIEKPVRKKLVFNTRSSVFQLYTTASIFLFALIGAGVWGPLADSRESVVALVQSRITDTSRAQLLTAISAAEADYHQSLNRNYDGRSGKFETLVHDGYTCSFDRNNTLDRVLACIIAQGTRPVSLVIGDSVGRDTFHALRKAYPDENFVMVLHSGCPAAEFKVTDKVTCFPGLHSLLTDVANSVNLKRLILTFRYRPVRWKNVESTLKIAKRITPSVFLLGVAPVLSKPLPELIRSGTVISPAELAFVGRGLSWSPSRIAKEAHQMASKYGAIFIDIGPAFCKEEGCWMWVDADPDRPIFWDDEHLTGFGIDHLSEILTAKRDLMGAK